MKTIIKYPHDRELGKVLLTLPDGRYYLFGVSKLSLKEKFEYMAHYSGYGLDWRW